HQVANHVLDIAADVAGLGKLGGVRLDEGHADQFRDAADEIRFADAGGAEKNYVLFGVMWGFAAFQSEPDVMIMVAERNAEDLLALILFDDKAVQILLHVARLVTEFKRFTSRCARIGRRFFDEIRLRRRPLRAMKMLADEIRKLPLK